MTDAMPATRHVRASGNRLMVARIVVCRGEPPASGTTRGQWRRLVRRDETFQILEPVLDDDDVGGTAHAYCRSWSTPNRNDSHQFAGTFDFSSSSQFKTTTTLTGAAASPVV